MANKQNFKPDEWTKILESTMLAGMAVSAAEPSGLWGALKEAFASSSALAAAKSNAGFIEMVSSMISFRISSSICVVSSSKAGDWFIFPLKVGRPPRAR